LMGTNVSEEIIESIFRVATLKMEVSTSIKTLVHIYLYAWRHIPKDRNLGITMRTINLLSRNFTSVNTSKSL
jgi:hypothetical protein